MRQNGSRFTPREHNYKDHMKRNFYSTASNTEWHHFPIDFYFCQKVEEEKEEKIVIEVCDL